MGMKTGNWIGAVALLAAVAGCDGGNMNTNGDGGADAFVNVSTDNNGSPCGAKYTEDVSKCAAGMNDYQPRKMMPGSNGWPMCAKIDASPNKWVLKGMEQPPATARSIAFESMAKKLWDAKKIDSNAFIAARDEYSIAEGLASRVGRRQDVTYPETPGDDKFACANQGIPAMYPDRCAGPAKLKPIIDDAFVKGIAGTKQVVQAARIEAALVWFFYLSMTSEVWTCSFDDITDCDAAAGYYTQTSARDMPAGLAKYVFAQGPETHNRIYDALLAERCWRDVDDKLPMDPQYKTLYDRAQAQLNKATLRGEALILRERIGRIGCLTGEAQEAQIEFVKIIGGLIDHGAALLDATTAATLKAYTSAPKTDAPSIAAAQAAIDKIFNCP